MKMRLVVSCLLFITPIAVTPIAAHADMLSTALILSEAEHSARVELVQNYLGREDIRSQMEAMGVDPALAAERVASLTDGQLEKLAFNIESAPAGGSTLGMVIAVLVILLLLEILGVSNIFRRF